ncbi:MAG: heavy metal translocating P-type ATPase [Acidobacteriota bacterium]
MMRDQTCPVCQVHAESVFRIEGMDCHEEVAVLERRLKGLPGLERMSADVMSGRLRVAYDAARLSASAVAAAVGETGMRAWLETDHATRVADAGQRARRWLLLVSGVSVAFGMALRSWGSPEAAIVALGVVAVGTGAWHWARRAWSSARLLSLDINVLMLLAVMGAMAIGEWSEAGTVAFLFALAQWLETRNMQRARLAIRALMDLAPQDALVRRSGTEARVPVDEVIVGDILIVRPGEKVPLDGTVVAGDSEVNQAPITGESMPVPKTAGAEVFGGTINGYGAIDVRVTHLRPDTTLARIIALVEHAQSERAPSQTFVESFARIYTPVVVSLAVGLAVVPPAVMGQPFGTWLYRALVLLVISCPCALVISTPVSIVSALAGAARKGVLIKGGRHHEALGRVRTVAFDKTGTLTHGLPEVAGVIPLNGHAVGDVLRVAAALESRSDHPVARAILRRADHDGVVAEPGAQHVALPGLGASAVVDGQPAMIGSHRLFEERGMCAATIDERMEALAAQGRTGVLVGWAGRAMGLIVIADAVRESARPAVDLLRQQGVEHIVMLTGDNASTASRVASSLGISEVQAELLPAGKVDAVRRLKASRGSVVMVGDGVNDAPALAAADVGIAMGAAGSDAALETADVALMADELLRIPYALRLSRATVRTIQVNVAISLGLKAIFLALAVTGTATLWMAVVADMGASLVVIANGLRLLRYD